MNLDNKKFIATLNDSGLSSNETLFRYSQEEDVITGRYSGGEILEGNVVGKKITDTGIELLFQCLTVDGELKCGESIGQISEDDEGRLRLYFDWKWLNGDGSGGTSVYIEVD